MNKNKLPGSPPGIPSWAKRLFKVGIGCLIAFLFLLGVLVTLFQFPFARTAFKDYLVSRLEPYLNANISIEGVSVEYFRGLALEKLRMTTDDGDIIRFERLSIGYSLPLIFKKNIFLPWVYARGLEVTVVSHPDGSTNFSNLFKASASESDPDSASPSGIQLGIGNLVLDESRFVMKYRGKAGEGRPDVRIDHLDARFSYSEELTLDIRELAAGINVPDFPHLALKGTAAFHLDDLRLTLSGIDVVSDASFLKVSGEMQFNGEIPTFDLQVACEPVNLPELKAGLKVSGNAEGSVRGLITGRGDFSRFFHHAELTYNETSLISEGTIGIEDSGRIDLDIAGAARHVNPAKNPFVLFSDKGGDLNADFNIKARFGPEASSREGRVALEILPSKSLWAEIVKGNIVADLAENRLTFSDVQLGTARGLIRVDGTVQQQQEDILISGATLSAAFGSLYVDGSLSHLFSSTAGKQANLKTKWTQVDIGALIPGKKVPGKVNVDINLEADLPPDLDVKKGHVRVWASAGPSQIAGIAVSSGHLLADWKQQRLNIESFDLDSDPGKVKADGDISPFQRNGRIRVDADLADLRPVYQMLHTYYPDIPNDLNLSGALRVEAAVAGSLDAATVSFNCKGQKLGVWEYTVKSFQLSGKRDGSLKQLEGEVDMAMTLSHESRDSLSLNGKINVMRGGSTDLTLDTLSFDSKRMPVVDALKNQGPIRLHVTKDGVVLDSFRMQSKEAVFSLKGELKTEGPQNCRLELSHLDLSRLSPLWEKQKNVSGLASASVVLRGSMAAPLIEAKIAATNLSGYQMSGADLTADLSYADSKGHVSVLLSKNGNKRFSANGTIDTRLQFIPFSSDLSKSRIDFLIQTSGLHLSDLPIPKSKEMAFDAAATVNITVSGETGSPDINGNIKLSDGYLTLPKNGLTYETMTATISFAGEKIEVQELFLKGDKEGFLRGAGTVNLKGFIPDNFDLTLAGENFFIPYQKAITARITPRLKLTGSLASPILTGDVTIAESKLNLDKMVGPSVPEIQIIESPTDSNEERKVIVEEKPWVFMNALAATVAVKVPKNAWLKGQDLSAEIAGEIGLRKEPGKSFAFLGDLNTIRGTYYFRGRHFRIEKGTVEFIGLEDPNPNINIKAVAKIQEADIIILLSGTARKLVLTLESEPPMEQSDIISYMVFGKPTDSLKSGQAFNAEKAAMRYSGSLLATELKSILGDMYFFDAFTLESGEKGGGAVSVGKYVRPNIFVTYRYGLAESEPNQVEISYEFNPNIRVETQLGNDKNNGVDLFWQLDF